MDKSLAAVTWTTEGETRILTIGKHLVHALDAAGGKAVWSIPKKGETFDNWRGDFRSTPAVVGDHLAFCGGQKIGLAAYTLTPEGPKKLWQTKMHDAYASPVIHDGHVYYIGGSRATCVELTTGKITWQKRLTGGDARLSSAVLADGKLIAVAAPWLYLIKADPGAFIVLGKVNLGLTKWTSPALADGKLFIKVGKSVVCYDLRRVQ